MPRTTAISIARGTRKPAATLRYDALDRLVETTDPAPFSHTTSFVYDLAGNVLTQESGSVLRDWAGNVAGQPGKGFAKILADALTATRCEPR